MSFLPEDDSPTVTLGVGASIETALLPYHLLGLRTDYGVRMSAALSPRALDFVTLTSIAGITGRPAYTDNDQFDPATGHALHLALADADVVVMYPCTARILAQCALGEVSCAATRVFAFASKGSVIVAPSIHPRMDRRLYTDHVARLRDVGCKIIGDDDLLTRWSQVVAELVERLGLKRQTATPETVFLDRLMGRGRGESNANM